MRGDNQALAGAIKALRHALGETQEGMARRLGLSFSGWRKWEYGQTTPRGKWLLKLVALCPDAETRALFGLDSHEQGINASGNPPPKPRGREEADRLRARKTAEEAIHTLFDLARAGSAAARRELKFLAERAESLANNLSRTKPRRK